MQLKLKFRPEIPLIVGVLWACTVQRLVMPIPQLWVNLIVVLLCLFLHGLYRSQRYEIAFSAFDAKCFLGFLTINMAAHWGGLFYSLGGDELYHADRAIPLGAIYRDLSPALSRTSMESFRSSMWKLFDPRHMNVIDLWRTLSFCLLVVALLFITFTRWIAPRLTSPARKQVGHAILAATLVSCAISFGYWLNVGPEIHAPGRLIPLLISNVVFGYNAFAFRIPGVIALALVEWSLMRYLRNRAPEQPLWWHGLVCLSIGFIPTLFYSAEAVEPSIYGFCTFVFVMLLVHKYLQEQRLEYLVMAGVTAAVGMLFRQSTVVTWVLVFCAFLLNRKNWSPRAALLVFTPFAIDIPYLYSVSHLGHHVVQGASQGKLELLRQAFASGVAVMSAINTTTWPWVIIAALALVVWIRKIKFNEAVPFILVVPAFYVFHTIWPYLWGLGRYQAEYVAPFIAFLLIFACVHIPRQLVTYSGAILAVGMVSTLEVNSNLSLDINYEQWPRMRITTSASFPYRETLGTLKRSETGGNFTILGGSPIYNKSVLWLSGFSFWESARWEQAQALLTSYLAQPRTPADVRAFVQANGIQAIVVQSGTRRESQHRDGMPGVSALITSLEKVPLDSKSYFYKQVAFGGEHGGVLTIYRPRD